MKSFSDILENRITKPDYLTFKVNEEVGLTQLPVITKGLNTELGYLPYNKEDIIDAINEALTIQRVSNK